MSYLQALGKGSRHLPAASLLCTGQSDVSGGSRVLQCQCKWTKEAGNIADSAGLSCRREFLQGVGTDGSGTDSQGGV